MKLKTGLKLGLFGAIGGTVYATAPNRDISRRARLRSYETVRIAHRGYYRNDGDAPENSLPAFERAVAFGFGIELDVRLTKDGVAVVFHDETFDRVCGVPGRVEDLTYEDLKDFTLFSSGEHIPTFAEALALIDGKTPLMIEIKAEYDVFDICKTVMKDLYLYPGEYCIQSFSPFVLKWFKDHEPYVLRGQLSMDFFDPDCGVDKPWPVKFISTNLLANRIGKPDFVSYEFHCGGKLPLNLFRRLHCGKTAGWTIRSREDLAFADQYFDIIIFDSFLPCSQ